MSERRPSSFIDPLPSHPNLELQQKRAKALLSGIQAGEAESLARLQALHPQPPPVEAVKLADVQLVVARGYGLAN